MINQLRDSILSELQKIDNVGELHKGIPKELTAFPSVFFNFDKVESTVMDSHHHERVYYFVINIFQETSKLGTQQAEMNLCDLIDSIIDLFDTSELDGLATMIEAVGGDIQSVETSHGPTLHGIITLAIHRPFSLR